MILVGYEAPRRAHHALIVVQAEHSPVIPEQVEIAGSGVDAQITLG